LRLIEILRGMFSDDDWDRWVWPAIFLAIVLVVLVVVAIKSLVNP
jgi:hypothetical protein